MPKSSRLMRFFQWLFLLSLLLLVITWLKKDELPPPAFYDLSALNEPQQSRTFKRPFKTYIEDQQYQIKPLYDYVLDGVVVSLHDADSIADIWHHGSWQDFLNVRDLCVIWGNNVANGVYQDMKFRNDSWTCWAYWPDQATGARFNMLQLSNNHILVDDKRIKKLLLSAERGDHVRFSGVLASYSNPANGFKRGTSTVRTDTGNGACETVYLQDFQIMRKANLTVRTLYKLATWTLWLSLAGVLVQAFSTAPGGSYRRRRR